MSFWESFWDVIWWFFLASVFITYFFTLFGVIGDIFRDRQRSGWVKALWILLLIVLPILTMLVYLIFHGRGMADRNQLHALEAQEATEAYIREVTAPIPPSPSEEITKAKSLLEAGTITTDEYALLKRQALQGAHGA